MNNLNKAKERLSAIKSMMISGPSEYVRPWYGQFLSRMTVNWSDKIPTAGVSITDKVNLYMNPDFLLGLEPLAAMELLEHEILHIVYLHPLRSKELGEDMDSNNHKIHNIATDAKINEALKSLTEALPGSVTIDRVNKALKEKKSHIKLEHGESSDTYYYKLRQFQEDQPQQGQGEGSGGFGETVDDHGTWQESVSNEAMAKAVVSQLGDEATKAAGIGNTPQDVLTQLNSLKKSLVNWKQQLNQFFVKTLKFEFEYTRNKRNRRYGILQPGKRKQPKLHVGICVDSSGSVGNDQFEQFFAEIDKLHQLGVDITVLDADCQVQTVYKYDSKNRGKVERHGNGGTAYTPAITKAKALKVDGIIYCGDFDCADTPVDPKLPFLWVGVNTKSPAPGPFGKTIYIDTV